MTREEMKFQVAVSCIQGVLEAKHGFFGELAPELASAEAIRIADAFVKVWYHETDVDKLAEKLLKKEEKQKEEKVITE